MIDDTIRSLPKGKIDRFEPRLAELFSSIYVVLPPEQSGNLSLGLFQGLVHLVELNHDFLLNGQFSDFLRLLESLGNVVRNLFQSRWERLPSLFHSVLP